MSTLNTSARLWTGAVLALTYGVATAAVYTFRETEREGLFSELGRAIEGLWYPNANWEGYKPNFEFTRPNMKYPYGPACVPCKGQRFNTTQVAFNPRAAQHLQDCVRYEQKHYPDSYGKTPRTASLDQWQRLLTRCYKQYHHETDSAGNTTKHFGISTYRNVNTNLSECTPVQGVGGVPDRSTKAMDPKRYILGRMIGGPDENQGKIEKYLETGSLDQAGLDLRTDYNRSLFPNGSPFVLQNIRSALEEGKGGELGDFKRFYAKGRYTGADGTLRSVWLPPRMTRGEETGKQEPYNPYLAALGAPTGEGNHFDPDTDYIPNPSQPVAKWALNQGYAFPTGAPDSDIGKASYWGHGQFWKDKLSHIPRNVAQEYVLSHFTKENQPSQESYTKRVDLGIAPPEF